MSGYIKVKDKQLRNSNHIQVCDLSYIHRKVQLTIVIRRSRVHLYYILLLFSLDLIQSRKETRQQKTLNAKLILENEFIKTQLCPKVDCETNEEKNLCPDRCEKGRQFLSALLRIQ